MLWSPRCSGFNPGSLIAASFSFRRPTEDAEFGVLFSRSHPVFHGKSRGVQDGQILFRLCIHDYVAYLPWKWTTKSAPCITTWSLQIIG